MFPLRVPVQCRIQDFPLGGMDVVKGGVASRGGYISKILYVKMKESGPLGGGVHGARPLDPPKQFFRFDIKILRNMTASGVLLPLPRSAAQAGNLGSGTEHDTRTYSTISRRAGRTVECVHEGGVRGRSSRTHQKSVHTGSY